MYSTRFLLTGLLAAGLALQSCAGGAGRLKSYQNQAPAKLVAEIDRHVYSPVAHGLRSVKAELVMDAAGFFAPASRPAEAVPVTVDFAWTNGVATFTTRNWPAKAAQVEKRLLQLLQGKEDDLVPLPYAQRLRGDTLSLSSDAEGNLIIHAQSPGKPGQAWDLTVDREFHVSAIHLTHAGVDLASRIEYGEGSPAIVRRTETQATQSGQTLSTSVEFQYQRVGEYTLPVRITYGGKDAGKGLPPPYTIELRNIKVE